MKVSYIAILMIAALGAGCGSKEGPYKPAQVKDVPAATIAAGQEETLFPLSVGTRWYYDVQLVAPGANRKVRYALEVKSVTPSGAGKLAAIELLNEDVVIATQEWRVDSTGVYQMSVTRLNEKTNVVEKTDLSPGVLVLPFPLEKGKEVKTSGKNLCSFGLSQSESKTTYDGIEIVDLQSEQKSAVRVTSNSDITGPKGEKGTMLTTAFFAPNIGLIKFVQVFKGDKFQTTERMDLLQHRPK